MTVPADDLLAQVGVSPFDAIDTEAERIDRFYSDLDEAGWDAPTRCSEWNRRHLLAHLCAGEDYTRAGLEGTVTEYLRKAGAANQDELNAWGVRQRAGLSGAELLQQFRDLSHANRRELRERGMDGTIDTSVGDYPVGRQAYYLACELATHADDAGVPQPVEDRAARVRWRAAFGRAAVAEAAEGVEAVKIDGGVLVRPGDVRLSDEDLVEAVADRLPPDHPIPADVRRALVVLA
jgi:uncharacterized protein (TIGR03083 family)